MSQYIFTIKEDPGDLEEPMVVLNSTKKWVAQAYLRNRLEWGDSLAAFTVRRSKDGVPLSGVDIDVYEFMRVDPGEL